MRYENQPDITFRLGFRSVKIKEPLPYQEPSYTLNRVSVTSQSSLDEMSARDELYGLEQEAYRIFDENTPELMEARFDLSGMRTLRTP